MGNLTWALVVVLCVNAVLFMGQIAMLEVNPDAGRYFDCKDSLLGSFDKNKCQGTDYLLDKSIAQNNLPSGSPTIESNTGNVFTDTFNAVKSWFLTTLGLQYLFDLVSAPYNFLQMFGLPAAFSFAIATVWYGITLFLIINWIKGGSA